MNHGNTNQHFADYRGALSIQKTFREERAAFCGESQVVGASSAVGRPLDELPDLGRRALNSATAERLSQRR